MAYVKGRFAFAHKLPASLRTRFIPRSRSLFTRYSAQLRRRYPPPIEDPGVGQPRPGRSTPPRFPLVAVVHRAAQHHRSSPDLVGQLVCGQEL